MYTPYELPDGMLLERTGKLRMWKSKEDSIINDLIDNNQVRQSTWQAGVANATS